MLVPVYDIVNCGPRRRFTANGKLVHNSDQINLQNLKRGSRLRDAMRAPEGWMLAAPDLSQIEPRVLSWLAEDFSMLSILQADDPYAIFGRQMFDVPDLTKASHPLLRQSAKSGLLGCGFGLGHINFAAQLLTGFLGAPPMRYDMNFLLQLGMGPWYVRELMGDTDWLKRVLAIPHTCTDLELVIHTAAAKVIVDKYRRAARPVTNFWKICSGFIEDMHIGRDTHYKNIRIGKERIELPNKMNLWYRNIRPREVKDIDGNVTGEEWIYGAPGKERKIYGAKLTENIVQAIARVVMTDGMLRIGKRYKNVLTVHDEAVALVPEVGADLAAEWMKQQMTIEPSYMPGIPLAASAGYGKTYGECK